MATVSAASPHRSLVQSSLQERALLIGAVTAVYGAIAVLSLAVLLHPPRLSLLVAAPTGQRIHVGWVLPGGTLWDRGVRPGDAVLRLDGRRPTQHDAGPWWGKEILVATASGRARVSAAALRSGRATWPLLAISPVFLLLGTLVLVRAPQPPVARSAYLLFSSAALALALAPAADDDQLWANAAELVAVPLFSLAFVLFFSSFPILRRRTPVSVLTLPPLVATLSGFVALLHPPLYDAASIPRVFVPLAYLLLGAGLLVRGYVGTSNRDARLGLLILAGGTVISILPFAALSLAPRLLSGSSLIAPERSILALALLPVFFAYAILCHHVLPIPLLQRWLVRGLLWAALLALAVAAAFLLRTLTGARSLSGVDLGVLALAVLVGGLTIRWLHERLLSIIEPLIFKDSYDYRASLQDLSRQAALAADLDALGDSLPWTLCRLINLEFAALLALEGDRLRVHGAAGSCDPEMLVPLVEAATFAGQDLNLAPLTRDGRPALVVPLRVHGCLVGSLCLGPKASGEPFRAVDRDLILTLSGHLATLLRNVQLTRELALKVRTLDVLNERLERAREEERACLAADLHDEPLQTALHLHRLLARRAGSVDGGEAVSLSRAVVDQLRRTCTAMRPSVLDDLGLHAALDMLVMDLEERSGIPIALEPEPELTSDELPPSGEVMLYRAAQEALNNCLRHASPGSIRVELRRCGDAARLEVADDGCGFVVPDRLDCLAAAGHLGLVGLLHRVERSGGRLRVQSAPGEGTTVRVDLPLTRASP